MIKIYISSIQLILFIVGFGLIWYYSGWESALGLLLVLWSNNHDYIRKDS